MTRYGNVGHGPHPLCKTGLDGLLAEPMVASEPVKYAAEETSCATWACWDGFSVSSWSIYSLTCTRRGILAHSDGQLSLITLYCRIGWGAAVPPRHLAKSVGLRPTTPPKYWAFGLHAPHTEGKWGSNIIIVCQRYDLPNWISYFDFLSQIQRVSLPHI